MAGWSTGTQTVSPGILRPGRILCGKSEPCLHTLLCNFNTVLLSTLLWAVNVFSPFASEAAPFQGYMWLLYYFIVQKWKLQQMARSSPRWCALVGHVAFFVCYYTSNPELQKDICFFLQLSSKPLLEEDRTYEAGLLSQAADLLAQIFPLPADTALHYKYLISVHLTV